LQNKETNMTNETTTEDAPLYPLANNANGNPLDVPPEAVAWRVRKLARRAGRPKVLFDVETGRPLELPLTVTFDDFVEQVNEPGRFRLEAVDGAGRVIAGCVAVTEVVLDDEDGASMPRNAADAVPHLHQLIAQLVEANTQVMKAMASAFGSVQPQPMRIEPVAAARSVPAVNANPMQALDAVREIGAMVNQVVGTIAAQRNGMAPSTAPQVG
jgi:hypothetical protein